MNDCIIGFDPGTKLVGWAVLNMDGTHLASGRWELGNSKDDVWTRLQRLPPQVDSLLAAWWPKAVACEITRPFKGNLHTHLVLAVSIGDIHSLAICQECVFVPVNPARLRSTGIHKKTLRYVQEAYGLNETPTEDQADAIGAAEWARRQIISGLLQV